MEISRSSHSELADAGRCQEVVLSFLGPTARPSAGYFPGSLEISPMPYSSASPALVMLAELLLRPMVQSISAALRLQPQT